MTDQQQAKIDAIALIDRVGELTERMMRRRLSLAELRELWAVTKQLMRFAAWANTDRFPDCPPITPDDSITLGRVVRLRFRLVKRTMRLLSRRGRGQR